LVLLSFSRLGKFTHAAALAFFSQGNLCHKRATSIGVLPPKNRLVIADKLAVAFCDAAFSVFTQEKNLTQETKPFKEKDSL